MSDRYSEVTASIADLRLRASGMASGDRLLTYQVRDRFGETVLEDGEGTGASPDRFELDVPLPEEDGDYVVLAAPVLDERSALLSFEVTVRGGSATIAKQGVVTPGALRFQRLSRTLGRSAVYPVRSIWRNRSLIRSMVRRDIAGRYAGSHAGVFWTIIHPLLMMLTYAFVFGILLQTRFANDNRPSSFVLYFLAGMLPWLPFSEAAGRASFVLIEHANFVKKLVFPLDILPVNVVFSGLFSQFFGVLIFFVALLISGREIGWTALYLPLLLVPQVLFTLGVSWLLAAMGVLFRDLGQLIGFLITVWFFLTPICYPESTLPQSYLWLFEKNPFYVLVRAYRAVLLEHTAPDWQPFLWLSAGSLLMLLVGYAWFHRMRRQFADLV